MTTVYVTGYKGRKYHTDKDCKYIKTADVQETTTEKAQQRGFDLCKECSGESQNPGGDSKSKLERILEAQDD